MARRLAKMGTPEALAAVVTELGHTGDAKRQLVLLSALEEGLKGRRHVEMPEGWSAVSESLVNSSHADVNAQATALALKFGDPTALAKLRGVLSDTSKGLDERKAALAALLGVRDAELPGTLQRLVAEPRCARGNAGTGELRRR